LGTYPEMIDLLRLWNELGVKSEGDRITFEPNAPLGAIRESITSAELRSEGERQAIDLSIAACKRRKLEIE
jgi:hypothetical protein